MTAYFYRECQTNELEEFVAKEGKMYNSKVNALCCLEAALQEQTKIKCDGQIPHEHFPQLLYTDENDENWKFLVQDKHLFLSYLDRVIHSNQRLLLELKVGLEQILMSTDKQAATFNAPNTLSRFITISSFVSEDHVSLPELQLGSCGASPKISRRNRQRKRLDNSQPTAVKLPKVEDNSKKEQTGSGLHFLSQGLKPPPKL